MAFIDPARIIWKPNPGPQTWLISCPVEDVLFGGARGGGKSDALLGDWLSHAGQYGKNAVGIIFRRTFPQLEELYKRSQVIYPALGAKWCAVSPVRSAWMFPNGAILRFRPLERDADADNYMGQSNTWIGADETGTWPDPGPLDKLRATLRTAHGVPCFMRQTANPGGLGHQWLKERYVDPAPAMTPFYDAIKRVRRVFIPSKLQDNPQLMADPSYMDRIRSSGPDWLVRAWLDGDWNASAGDSFFTEAILLRNGSAVEYPAYCDNVFATIDTGVKTGKKRDGTAVCFWAYSQSGEVPLTLLDWDILQIQGALLDNWLPSINARLEEFAKQCRARMGSFGAYIEDAQSGAILIQQAALRGMNAEGINTRLTMMGKDERALLAAPYVYQHKVKLSKYAYEKVMTYKETTKNHLLSQVTSYRLGIDNIDDDGFDAFMYGVIIAFDEASRN